MVGSCRGGCSVLLHVVGFAEYFRSVLVRAFLFVGPAVAPKSSASPCISQTARPCDMYAI